jgi:Fe-S-cluster containining protein
MPAHPLATTDIDALWGRVAADVGFKLTRTRDAYATSDGAGEIAIGAVDTLDGDDTLAQLVFHELCHAITEGEAALHKPDWGLDNVPEHIAREHACLRVQAYLAGRFGLRALMAPTTPYRTYYGALPADPLLPLRAGAEAQAPDDDACARAVAALQRFEVSPWRAPIEAALAETAAALADAAAAAGAHPLGFPLGPQSQSCGSCGWLYVGGRGVGVTRCRQSAPANGDGLRTERAHPACARWEPPVDCRTCGACCREAYHSVTVSMRDPVVWKEPQLIVRHGARFEIRRDGERCAALDVRAHGDGDGGGDSGGARYGCTIYDNRPRPCREFEAGGRHCLDARRRVGLSARDERVNA